MILAKNKEDELCLIGNQSLEWYKDYKPIKVLELPIELRRTKCSNKLQDIIDFQSNKHFEAIKEMELREHLLKILIKLRDENK